jgi:hypothetical protein
MQGVAGCGSAEEAGTGDADLSVDVGDRLIVLDDSVVVPSYALPAGFLLAVDRYKNYGGEPVVLLSDRDPNAVRSDGTANLDTPSYNRTGVVFVVEDYEEWGSVSVRMLGRHGGEQDVLAAESAGTLGGSRPTLGDAVGDSEWTHTFTASVGRVFQGDIASSKYGKLGYMVDPAIGATVNVRLLTERDGGDLSRVVLGMSGALAGTAQLRLTAPIKFVDLAELKL